ncbi:MAG: hypothetical protein WC565_01785 [Parcubacteria group bacterium]
MARGPSSTNKSRGNSQRYLDTVRIESENGESFDIFNSLSIANDFMSPSEAAFEVGDDGTWSELEDITGMGKKFKVFVNDRLRLTGRVELNDIPVDSSNGAVTRFTVRTLMADAMYACANPNVKVKSTSIKDFILYLWAPLGVKESDFVFLADVSRNLMTGKSSDGTKPKVALEDLNEEQAKVNPPETIYQATDRHLQRHGFMIWDAPDGKLVVGAPDDKQSILYQFRMFGEPSRRNMNNVLSMQRTKDWSGVPGLLYMAGTGGNKDWTKSKVRGFVTQNEIDKAGFYRPVLLINEGLKNDKLAQRQAEREMTNRSKRLDTWTITVDGLSYFDGMERFQYAIDTTAEVISSVAGGPNGAYLVTRVQLNRNVNEGDTAELTLLKRGLWRL